MITNHAIGWTAAFLCAACIAASFGATSLKRARAAHADPKAVTAEVITEIRITVAPNAEANEVGVTTVNIAGENVISATDSRVTGFGCQYNPILEGTFQLFIDAVPAVWTTAKQAGDDWWISGPPGKAFLQGPEGSKVLIPEGAAFNNCFAPASAARVYSLQRISN